MQSLELWKLLTHFVAGLPLNIMFTWPTFLPNPDQNLSADTETSAIRSNMDSGRTRVRRRFTSEYEVFSAVWTFDEDQFSLFQSIFAFTLKSGTEWFTISLPVGDGLTPVTARFASTGYTKKHVPVMHWEVSATLELQDKVYPITEDDLEDILLLENDVDAFEAAVDALNHLVNEELPGLLT